jgi:hypothetical protein
MVFPVPIPLAVWSKVWVCSCSSARIVGLNAPGRMVDVSFSCECCVMSGRGLCDGPIPCPEESYHVCVCMCVCVCVSLSVTVPLYTYNEKVERSQD